MKNQPKIIMAALLAAWSMAAGSTLAASIGAKFTLNNNGGIVQKDSTAIDVLHPTESAGAPGYAQTNWNDNGRYGQSAAEDDSIASGSGVTFSWDSDHTSTNGPVPATPDDKLMFSYLGALGLPNQTGDPTASYTFFGQPDNGHDNRPNIYAAHLNAWMAANGATNYSVIVYASGNRNGGDNITEYWVEGVPSGQGDPPSALAGDLTSHVFLSDASDFTGTYVQVPDTANSVGSAQPGNYIIFPIL